MKLGSILILLLFIVWGVGSTYWYTCKIKQTCPSVFNFASANSGVGKAESKVPFDIYFNWGQPKANVTSSFENLKNGLLARMSNIDTLKILGNYFETEPGGDSLGLTRAQEIAALFAPEIDEKRIKIESIMENTLPNFDKNNPFEGAQFNIISGHEVVVTETEPTPEEIKNGYVEEIGNKLIVHFPYGSVRKLITSQIENSLNGVASDVKGKDFTIDIIGHTDNEGSEEGNYQLGRKRAWALKAYLMKKGLDPLKLKTGSKGEKEPLTDNDSKEGRSKNRRVELTINKN